MKADSLVDALGYRGEDRDTKRTLANVKAEALFNAMDDTHADVEAKTLRDTHDEVKAKAVEGRG